MKPSVVLRILSARSDAILVSLSLSSLECNVKDEEARTTSSPRHGLCFFMYEIGQRTPYQHLPVHGHKTGLEINPRLNDARRGKA
jgi:hypothetical protein